MESLLFGCEELMEDATGDRKSSESLKHFIAHLNGLDKVSPTHWENHRSLHRVITTGQWGSSNPLHLNDKHHISPVTLHSCVT